MISSLKPSAAAAAVAMAYLVLNLNALAPISVYSFQLSSPTRAFIASSTSLHERLSNNEKDAAVAVTPVDEWMQRDLEKQLSEVKLSEFMARGQKKQEQDAIKIIFSDIDGSLIHYPKHFDETQQDDNNKIIALPPSATGMRGILSSRTLTTCRDLRVKKGIKLVLVTGARTSTLLNRLPYLPKADAYCTEAGGRIFYPTNIDNDCCHDEEIFQSQFTYKPVEYSGAVADEDLKPFGLREDMTWRKQMEMGGAGTEAYAGNEVSSNRCDMSDEMECMIDYESTEGFPSLEDEVPITQRQGHLWDFANRLVEEEGFVLDTKSYSTCFRVNKKHQTNDKFDALLVGEITHPEAKIGKSTNLGCIDFYPRVSGKENCCQYLANEIGFNLATESVCICDDDNDVEMALACSHSYIPSLTSKSMVDTLRKNQSNFTQTFGPDISSTAATEAALNLIYDMA